MKFKNSVQINVPLNGELIEINVTFNPKRINWSLALFMDSYAMS